MSCAAIIAALSPFEVCTDTPHGSRVSTHCLYPSFEPVEVYVVGFGNGFRVRDLGGARREAWLHGVDEVLVSRIMNQEAAKYQVRVEAGGLVADAPTPEWLLSAIVAVSNASASVAKLVIERNAPMAEEILVDRIERSLLDNLPGRMIRKSHHFRGKSGKDHVFDFAIKGRAEETILISAIADHHFSISSRYVAFADTTITGFESVGRFAVFDKPIDGSDAALLGQVADLVPIKSLIDGAYQFMATHRWRHLTLKGH